MLDTATKKRIDDCRDILVGKLPDPKAQIEQITIGLIYKFMDDMDKESIELGGQAKFFTDYKIPDPENPGKKITVPFAQYAWNNLFNTKVTATEMLRLYSEAITGMDKNPNIPALFRDIFKNAFLPYRDPETLKLFLKTIGEFEYTHSEKLGDAFEYLLSVMGSQGDAGQFRTPRHIIDFIVAVVDPGKNDTILDPACGTAGFLISAFKHIDRGGHRVHYRRDKACLVSTTKTHDLTPDERKKIIQNFTGYDISPDMVRLSLVNLYLHGFSDPHIWEYDSLSSEERWGETFNVILANPPFMSPKGGIRPHKKFSISSNRSEVLFVDYIAEHLNPKGRAGIIVPEGVIFQSGTAYKDLRKMLVDNYLYAVVSLPAGVFNPYSGVKTSILLMDKELAKKNDEILFVKIDNDGYGLGAQRNAVKGGQLEEAIKSIHDFITTDVEIRHDGNDADADVETRHALSLQSPPQQQNGLSAATGKGIAHVVSKKEIAKNGDYNLSGERYRVSQNLSSIKYEIVAIGDVFQTSSGGTPLKEKDEYYRNGNIPWLRSGEVAQGYINSSELFITEVGLKNSSAKIFPFNTVLVAMYGATAGQVGILKFQASTNQAVCGILPNEKAIPEYLYLIVKSQKDYLISLSGGGAQPNISQKIIRDLQIPLPPISIQEQIVAEIEGYQKIIDGAKAVVENYKPKIDIDPDWEMVELGEVCESISDGDHLPPPKSENGVPFITISNINAQQKIDFSNIYFVPESYYNEIKPHRKPKHGDILYTVTGSFGIPVLINFDKEFCFQRHIGLIRPNDKINRNYLFYYLQTPDAFLQAERSATGMAQKTVALKSLRQFIIPIPPLEIQEEIVSQLEKEQALVNANKELIEIFEQKIKDRIAKVWGADKKEPVVYVQNDVVSMAAEE